MDLHAWELRLDQLPAFGEEKMVSRTRLPQFLRRRLRKPKVDGLVLEIPEIPKS